MTCIVGLVHRNKVYMGGDSAGIADYDLTIRADTKVFQRGPFLIGFTSSFRMGQILRYHLDVPEQTDEDDMEFMVKKFISSVRFALKGGGFLTKDKEAEKGGNFLVGYKSELYEIHSDFQVAKPIDNMASCGCGSNVALGAMYAMNPRTPPAKRVERALEIAEHLSAGVRRPFIVISSQEEKLKPAGAK